MGCVLVKGWKSIGWAIAIYSWLCRSDEELIDHGCSTLFIAPIFSPFNLVQVLPYNVKEVLSRAQAFERLEWWIQSLKDSFI